MNVDIDLSPITTLIIDESRYARSFVRSAMHTFGLRTVHEAADGPAAFEILARTPIQLIIVGHEIRPMNGIDFTRLLRAGQVVPCVEIPVIMISGDAERTAVAAARTAGVNEFLVKPLSTESLFRRVRAIFVNPRPFVHSPTFTGPDRRGLNRAPPGPDRRIAPPLARPPAILGVKGIGGPKPPPPPPPPGTIPGPARHYFPAGTTIFAEGDSGDVAYVVESGAVEILKAAGETSLRLGLIGPNGVFGEMALIDGKPRMASARTTADTTCLSIPMASLRAQLGKTPDLVILVLETLLADIRRMGRELGETRAALEHRRTMAQGAAGATGRPAAIQPSVPPPTE